jgi:hypothetical protein
MTTKELITEFCNHFGYNGRLDNSHSLQEVKEWLRNAIAERMPTEEEIRKEFPIGSTEKMKYNSDYAEQMKENQYKRLGAFWFRSRMEEKNDVIKCEKCGNPIQADKVAFSEYGKYYCSKCKPIGYQL